ncbi:potassium voltage-gated channel subfamily G member 4 [Denticeps clupeoides]|uniref:Potassium voltage-gated channel, subfamily G, member 4b n=1 Tax=Denticeps clupeoides TaxID=299321 RepID=A0AAY4BSK7_9TELE|nr:potassium voltage-gated channel subfamily G member 4-like [Denticeps clupeoides]
MPIISNTNPDLSISSDDSSLDRFFTEIPEAESKTIKGVYYHRAQLLREPGANQAVDHAALALINVGGDRYSFPWSTLDEFPLTRLGQLHHCCSLQDIRQLCDDYDEASGEFFFDRSAVAFRVIHNFLAAGKLRLLRQTCAVSLWDELNYWGVNPAHMERCCRRKMMLCVDEVEEKRRQEEEWWQRRNAQLNPPGEDRGYHRLMGRLREVVDNPHSGWLGRGFACFSVVMVAVTVVNLCLSTMPNVREEESKGECSERCHYIFIVETICVVWFSMEFVLRFLQAHNKVEFAQHPLNIIDVMAILPYYVSLVLENQDNSLKDDVHSGSGRGYLDKLGLILRVLRALRILYVMRLARHSLGLQTLGLTMQRSTREFGLLLLFLCVAVALFSPLVHLAETELGVSPYHSSSSSPSTRSTQSFSSIPTTYWWAIISMTTVGYGDMVPNSVPGQVVAFSSILSGILIMAFPATSIFHRFSRCYQELKHEHEMLCKVERVACLVSRQREEQINNSFFFQPVGVSEAAIQMGSGRDSQNQRPIREAF